MIHDHDLFGNKMWFDHRLRTFVMGLYDTNSWWVTLASRFSNSTGVFAVPFRLGPVPRFGIHGMRRMKLRSGCYDLVVLYNLDCTSFITTLCLPMVRAIDFFVVVYFVFDFVTHTTVTHRWKSA